MGTTQRNILLAAIQAVHGVFSASQIPQAPKTIQKSSGYRKRSRTSSVDFAVEMVGYTKQGKALYREKRHKSRSRYTPGSIYVTGNCRGSC